MAWFKFWQEFIKLLKAYGILPQGALPAPPVPTNLVADQAQAGFIRITWDEGSGLAQADSYQVYRDGIPLAVVNNQIYLDGNLPPQQSFTYQVQAISAQGSSSALSAPLVVSTTINTAPVWDTTASLQSLTEGVAYSLDLNTICDDADGQTITYTITQGTLPGGVGQAGAIVSGTPNFASQGDYPVTFSADDGHGGVASFQTTYHVVNVDITAPSIPSGLVASNITANTATLTWNASTDTETGVSSYKIYQKIGSGNSVFRATSSDTTFNESGLSPSTAYSYKVSAVDGAGNESGLSSSVPVSTPAASDTTPPTVPTGLTVTSVTSSSVGLSWNASTDVGSGVGGYNIYFSTTGPSSGFTSLNSTATTSQTVTNLGSGTNYWFKVTAFDLASPSNESAQSTSVAATTTAAQASVKFHRGHYLLAADRMTNTADGYLSSYITGAPQEVVGWEQIVNWSHLEPQRGVYNFTKVDALLQLCAQNNKRLVLQVLERSFNSGGDTTMLPQYLATEPNGGGGWYLKPLGGYIPKYWLPAIMSRFRALMTALAQRYDSHPYFEAIVLVETDTNFSTGPSDYSVQGYLNGLYSLISEQAAQWPHTAVMQQANFIPSNQTGMEDYVVNHMIPARIEMSAPDIKGTSTATPLNGAWGQRIVAGYRYVNSVWTPGFTKYETVMGLNSELQDPDMGGKTASGTCAQDFAQAQALKLHRMFWERKNYTVGSGTANLYFDNTSFSGTPGSVLSPDIKTYLGVPVGTHLLNTTIPSYYASVTTT